MKRRDALTGLAGLGITSFTGCLRLSQESGDDTTTDPSTEPNNTTAEQTPNTPPTPDTTPTENETPTPTEEETPTPTEEETVTPLGLYETGPSPLLFENHKKKLRKTGFEVQWSKIDQTISEIADERSYRGDQRGVRGEWVGRDGASVTIYRTTTDGYWRETVGNEYTYGNDGDSGRLESPLWESEIRSLIKAADWGSPTIVQQEPTTVWEVQAEELGTEGVELNGSTVISISSVTLQANEDNVIQQLDAKYVLYVPHREEEVEFESSYSIESIGGVSVDEPDWLSTAEENTPSVSASVTDDQQYITLQIESGNRLEPETVITVWDITKGEPIINLRLDEPLEPETTAYIWQYRGPQYFPSGKISRGSRPDDASPIELTSGYQMWARRKHRHYFEKLREL